MRTFFTPRPTRRHKEHRMDTSKANPFEKNGKRPGKLARQPQKYETTLLSRQRTGPRLTYLRRDENKGSQLKRHGQHKGKPTRKPKTTKPTTRKSHWGLEPVFLQQGSQRQSTKGNPFKTDGKRLRHKEHRRDGNKANQLKMIFF